MEKEVYHYPTLHFISDVWKFIFPYKWRFIFWSFVRAFSNGLELVVPILLGKVIDTLTKSQDFTLLVQLIAGVAIIELISPTIRLKSKYFLGKLGIQIAKDIRLKGLDKVMELDLAWHEEKMSGAVMQKVTNGATSVKDLIRFLREKGYAIIITLLGTLIVFGYLHIKYLLLLCVTIVSYLLVERHWDILIAQAKNEEGAVNEKLFGRTYEFIHNIGTIKSLGMESAVKKKAVEAENKLFGISNKISYLIMNRKWRIMQTIAAFFKSAFIVLVCIDVLRGNLSAGMVLVYISYFSKIHEALNDISDSVENIIENKNGVYRLMTVLDSHSEVDAGKHLKPVQAINSIEFRNVSFTYKEKEVLSGLNFIISKGEHVGIIGQSGVGKSTLFKLLLKLYLPTQGEILINTIPTHKIKRRSITRNLTIVPQETEVFNLSFRDNITLTTQIDGYSYKQALNIAACRPILNRLPLGDQTSIGEKGIRLSGGEKQRLGIARALYKDADVILLDEATSHLDSKTEREIISAMDRYLVGKTIIVIAHRFSTLRTMDRILVFSKGNIIEDGKYNDLISAKGYFYRLHKLQTIS